MENTTIFCEDFAEDVVSELKKKGYDIDHYVTQKVYKQNDQLHFGLVIKERAINCSPTIYLDKFETSIESGLMSREKAVEDVANAYINSRMSDVVSMAVKKELPTDAYYTIKMLNINKNRHYLEDTPIKMLTDEFALYICGIIDTGDSDGIASFKVTNQMIEAQGLDVDKLFDEAFENLKKESFKVNDMASVLTNLGLPAVADIECPKLFDVPLFVASIERMTHGSVVLARTDILENFAKEHGDFYILPSSVHELIFVPANIVDDPEGLKELVHHVNTTELSEEDYLSDNVYYYSKLGLKSM